MNAKGETALSWSNEKPFILLFFWFILVWIIRVLGMNNCGLYIPWLPKFLKPYVNTDLQQSPQLF